MGSMSWMNQTRTKTDTGSVHSVASVGESLRAEV